jgi:hypothetical protein
MFSILPTPCIYLFSMSVKIITIIYLNSTKHLVILIENAHFLCDMKKYFTLEELQDLQSWPFQGCWLQYLGFPFNQCVPVRCLTNNYHNNNSIPTQGFQIIYLLYMIHIELHVSAHKGRHESSRNTIFLPLCVRITYQSQYALWCSKSKKLRNLCGQAQSL